MTTNPVGHLSATPLEIGAGRELAPETVVGWAESEAVPLSLSPESRARVERSHEFLKAALSRGIPCYGTTTGFGPLVTHPAHLNPERQQLGLIRHLCAGVGEPLARDEVRMMLLVRAHTLAQGYSGVRPATMERFLELCATGPLPRVPRSGSVGASGDLIPMAHAVAAWCGEGELLGPASPFAALELCDRDALALVNGTALTTALACKAVVRTRRLAQWGHLATAETMAALGIGGRHLEPRLHQLRGHPHQEESASRVRGWHQRLGPVMSERPLQEPYSLRCAPAVLGALLESLQGLERGTHDELRGVSDNPLIDGELEEIFHGGNFHAQRLAAQLDATTSAVVQAGNLAERQLMLLLQPETNGGLPPLLAATPGADSGFAGAQLATAAVLARMRSRTVPLSSQSLPTNLFNQDVVPMSVEAGWNLLTQLEDYGRLLATLLLASSQAALGHGQPSAPEFAAERLLQLGRMREDRPLWRALDFLQRQVLTEEPQAV